MSRLIFRVLWIFILPVLMAACRSSATVGVSSPALPADTPEIAAGEAIPAAVGMTEADSAFLVYREALAEMQAMLEGQQPADLKRAVYLVENAWWENNLDYEAFCDEIRRLAVLCDLYRLTNSLLHYTHDDKDDVAKNGAIFRVMTDTLRLSGGRRHLPFRYDFEDFAGHQDWSSMFVSRLLATGRGNCHSLPLLYRILAAETGARAWLALAPNHIYIKCHNRQMGWYNTELTSATFPADAQLAASGYITLEAIRHGLYMDTLSAKQAIALCVTDLAKGYERRMGRDSLFVLSCTGLALEHFPDYVNALLLKAETLKYLFEQRMKKVGVAYPAELLADASAAALYTDMEHIYRRLLLLGYREMPEQMYRDWLQELRQAAKTIPVEK